MITTPSTKPKLTIALVSPASISPNPQEVDETKIYLEKNFPVQVLFADHSIKWQPPAIRAQQLLNYLLDPNIDIIWAVRGGEGSADLLPFLHEKMAALKQSTAKLIVGFSDITALLVYFSQQYQWPCLHGMGAPQLLRNRVDETTQHLTTQLLFNTLDHWEINLQPLNAIAKIKRTLTAPLTGGNLSLINISIKDIWEIDTANKIIILEDVNEKPHVIGRTLKYLQRINKFTQAAAIILGDFLATPIGKTFEEQEHNTKIMQKTLEDFAQTQNCPVLQTKQIGHGKTNLPFYFDQTAQLILQGEEAVLLQYYSKTPKFLQRN